MANGFFLGGVSEGFNASQKLEQSQQQINQQGSYQKSLLALEQQKQQHAQERDLFARADKQKAELMTVAGETIKELKLRGKDNASIAKAIQPIIQSAKRLTKSAGGDDTMIDAQVATLLAQPGFDPKSVTGGAPATQSSAQPAVSTDIPTGEPAPPGQNITGPGTTVTGVEYGPTQLSQNGKPVASPAASTTQPANEVDHWTQAMLSLPSYAPTAMRETIKSRLDDAIKRNTPDATVHFVKTEDGNEIPLVIRKQGGNVTVTDTNGNPYVVPTGDENSDKKVIADAIISGKQPPVLTGLYKNAKGVKAALARQDFDLTKAQLEWDAARKQVQSLNGPQMTRYVGLATSVVNTIDEINNLAGEMKNSGIPLANRAKLAAFMQLEGNSEKGQLAARYIGAVTTLKEEFANLVQGGYAPTEAAFALANKQINEDYGVLQMRASLTEVQRLIRYRLNAVPNLNTMGPGGENRYRPPAAAPAQGASSSAPPPPPPGFVVTSPQ